MSILGSKNNFNPQLCGLRTSMVGNTYDVMHWTWGKQFWKINNIFFQMLMQIEIPNTHLALVWVFYWKKCHLYLKWIEKDCNQDKFLMDPTHPLECCFSSVINKKETSLDVFFLTKMIRDLPQMQDENMGLECIRQPFGMRFNNLDPATESPLFIGPYPSPMVSSTEPLWAIYTYEIADLIM